MIQDQIEYIREMLGTIGEGRTNVSPYDTAWVALVPALNGDDMPQFPDSLQWIADHQLPDGSWGDELVFLSYDRLLNTIACVVALRTWNIHHDKSAKGLIFWLLLRERHYLLKFYIFKILTYMQIGLVF